jgi:hypothetical protein
MEAETMITAHAKRQQRICHKIRAHPEAKIPIIVHRVTEKHQFTRREIPERAKTRSYCREEALRGAASITRSGLL